MKKKKSYAIKLFVKPKNNGDTKWKGKTFKGITRGETREEAINKAVDMVRKAVIESQPEIKDSKDLVTVKECELFNDFIIN